jgi:hypothetical protein
MAEPAEQYCDAFLAIAGLEQPIEPSALLNHLTNRGFILQISYDGGATFNPFELKPERNAHQLVALAKFILTGLDDAEITCPHSSWGTFSAPFRRISSTEIHYSTRPWNDILAVGWNPDVRVFKVVQAE